MFPAGKISHIHTPNWSDKLHKYVANAWNWIDLLSLFLYLIQLPLRYSCPSRPANMTTWDPHYPTAIHTGRSICSVSALFFVLRILHVFSVSSQLGPKIQMIKQMVGN